MNTEVLKEMAIFTAMIQRSWCADTTYSELEQELGDLQAVVDDANDLLSDLGVELRLNRNDVCYTVWGSDEGELCEHCEE